MQNEIWHVPRFRCRMKSDIAPGWHCCVSRASVGQGELVLVRPVQLGSEDISVISMCIVFCFEAKYMKKEPSVGHPKHFECANSSASNSRASKPSSRRVSCSICLRDDLTIYFQTLMSVGQIWEIIDIQLSWKSCHALPKTYDYTVYIFMYTDQKYKLSIK